VTLTRTQSSIKIYQSVTAAILIYMVAHCDRLSNLKPEFENASLFIYFGKALFQVAIFKTGNGESGNPGIGESGNRGIR
jgi:hypothetical protein